jgi:putative methionine-R-sulfoxide reductase with GAF domain
VPVLDAEGDVMAVLDIDSEQVDFFDQDDQRGLERMVAWFATPRQ